MSCLVLITLWVSLSSIHFEPPKNKKCVVVAWTYPSRPINHTHYWTASIDIMLSGRQNTSTTYRVCGDHADNEVSILLALSVIGNLLMRLSTWISPASSFAPQTWRHHTYLPLATSSLRLLCWYNVTQHESTDRSRIESTFIILYLSVKWNL